MAWVFDSIVVGGDLDGLVAAVTLARRGAKVLLLEENAPLGGAYRTIEFAPGFRAAPLAADHGYLAPEVMLALKLESVVEGTADPALVAVADDAPLLLHSSVAATAQAIKRFSARDARAWPDFAQRMYALSGFLKALYRQPAPRIEANTAAEAFALLGLARQFRKLGPTGMVDLLRTLPMALADLLDDTFESERLKGALAALGVMDVCQGPMSGGTAFTFLHRHVGGRLGVFNERSRLVRDSGAFERTLTERAAAAGIVVETPKTVQELIVRDGRAAGVRLAGGEEVRARTVISSLDPYRSLLGMVDPVHLAPELVHAVRNIRCRGVTTKILLAMDSLPEVPGTSAPLAGSVLIAPSMRYVERAYDATKYGQPAQFPFIEVRFPSVTDRSLAPQGKHVAVLHVQYTPFHLRDGHWDALRDVVADRALAQVEEHLPGFTSRVRARAVLTPADLQASFGLREGAVSQGEMMLDQILFMRPVPGLSRSATPIHGYFLCGAGAHPGPGISGLSGWLAARAASAA